MLDKLHKSVADSTKVLTLACASFLSTPTLRSEGADPPSSSKNSNTTTALKREIPADIALEAKLKNIALDSIKFENNRWVACFAVPGAADACIELGNKRKAITSTPAVKEISKLRNGDTLLINSYGGKSRQYKLNFASDTSAAKIPDLGTFVRSKDQTFTFTLEADAKALVTTQASDKNGIINTLPKFQKESDLVIRTNSLSLINSYIKNHPEEEFLLIVTVPAHCPPCRALDQVVQEAFSDSKSKDTVKTFILEYFDFESANKEVLGSGGIYPSLLTFRKDSATQKSAENKPIPNIIGQMNGATKEQVLEPISENVSRTPHQIIRGGMALKTLRELMSNLKK
jgi:hypothetical protein